jgi:hypothetical protein
MSLGTTPDTTPDSKRDTTPAWHNAPRVVAGVDVRVLRRMGSV